MSASLEDAKPAKPQLYVVPAVHEESDIRSGDILTSAVHAERPGNSSDLPRAAGPSAEACKTDMPPQTDAEPIDASLEICPLEITGDDESPHDRFLGITAVLDYDREELGLLERIWNLKESNLARFEDLEALEEGLRAQWARLPQFFMPPPAYVHSRLKNAITTVKTMLGLIEDLDRHRHGAMRARILQFGAERCPVPVSKHDYTLPQSDWYLAALMEEQILYLERFGRACLEQANLVRGLDVAALEGRLRGIRNCVDRSKWEEPFRGYFTLVERQSRSLRRALCDRAASLARSPVTGLGKPVSAPPQFAIAPKVVRASLK